MKLKLSILLCVLAAAAIGAPVYPARTNGPNVFYGTNTHFYPRAFLGDASGLTNYPAEPVILATAPPFYVPGSPYLTIQGALNAATNAATNTVIYIPAGTYTVTNTLQITGRGTRLRGAGCSDYALTGNSTKLLFTQTDRPGIIGWTGSGGQDIHISGLWIQGPGRSGTAQGMFWGNGGSVYAGQGATVENCVLWEWPYGVVVSNYITMTFDHVESYNAGTNWILDKADSTVLRECHTGYGGSALGIFISGAGFGTRIEGGEHGGSGCTNGILQLSGNGMVTIDGGNWEMNISGYAGVFPQQYFNIVGGQLNAKNMRIAAPNTAGAGALIVPTLFKFANGMGKKSMIFGCDLPALTSELATHIEYENIDDQPLYFGNLIPTCTNRILTAQESLIGFRQTTEYIHLHAVSLNGTMNNATTVPAAPYAGVIENAYAGTGGLIAFGFAVPYWATNAQVTFGGLVSTGTGNCSWTNNWYSRTNNFASGGGQYLSSASTNHVDGVAGTAQYFTYNIPFPPNAVQKFVRVDMGATTNAGATRYLLGPIKAVYQ